MSIEESLSFDSSWTKIIRTSETKENKDAYIKNSSKPIFIIIFSEKNGPKKYDNIVNELNNDKPTCLSLSSRLFDAIADDELKKMENATPCMILKSRIK